MVLFSLTPGEQVRRRINGLEVVLAGVDLSQPLPKIAGDCVVVLASPGSLDLATARARARELPAQVVVGRGFGAELPVEDVNGRVLALSLGPFLSSAPHPDPQGRVLGITCTKDSVRWRSVPVKDTGGVPEIDLEKTARELDHD